ncbi:sugar ABC transporter permease [Kribbella sp. NBC_00709]|uniref:carbohydrate ABC transporter permease n=1 Tax=Kribbella sp. NBC_00709 TaxID=2975972 RepID=UPI002E2936F1|nr:sugar ABC transporter permease [Kribbella sp. NBC_00709]
MRARLTTISMVGPALVLFVVMLVIPVGLSLYLSLTDWDGYSANPAIVGLKNYVNLTHSAEAIRAGWVTLLIAAVGTVLLSVLGLGFALLVNGASRLNAFFRIVLFYPHVLSALVVGFLWSAVLGTSGVVNGWLTSKGAEVLPFLSNPNWALASLIGVLVWAGFGVNVVLYLAGLQTVSRDLLEAARIDGASSRQTFFDVTLPALAPVVTVNLVLSLVTLLKTYDLVVSLTGGGPAGSTQTAAYLILWDSFHNNALGFGSAQSVVLMVITAGLALTVARLRSRADQGVRA